MIFRQSNFISWRKDSEESGFISSRNTLANGFAFPVGKQIMSIENKPRVVCALRSHFWSRNEVNYRSITVAGLESVPSVNSTLLPLKMFSQVLSTTKVWLNWLQFFVLLGVVQKIATSSGFVKVVGDDSPWKLQKIERQSSNFPF